MEEYFMRQALNVAREALEVGEVPVGCVIVLRESSEYISQNEKCTVTSTDEGAMKDEAESAPIPTPTYDYLTSPEVIISHGANQVNATRDATRHAECVAIDRILTGSMVSDQSRLPQKYIAKSTTSGDMCKSCSPDDKFDDDWVNIKGGEGSNHWKNRYGWGSGKTFKKEIFQKCDLYVTCEPCVMCAAALARVGISRVFYGCKNSRFGGNGSLLSLHLDSAIPSIFHSGYDIFTGILEKEAITLLRSFYDRENFHAPDDKRKRKY